MEQLFADVIVDISQEKLDHTFSYIVPLSMQCLVNIGTVVQVPFGKGNRLTKGYIVGFSKTTDYDLSKMKEIQMILAGGDEVTCEDHLVTLAAWIRDTYGSTMIQALKTVIPVKKKVRPVQKKSIELLLNEEETKEKLAFYMKKNQKARYRLLEALQEVKEIPYELAVGKLNISSAAIRAMEEQKIISCHAVTVYRNPLSQNLKKEYEIILNEEQQQAADGIWRSFTETGQIAALIHGVTGSGKTEVYMELIDRCLKQGKQAIVLIPEIALTYQTVMRFYRKFGDTISIIHSRLSAGERYDQFERAKRGNIQIMIGPRSALFTPFPHLGLIVIDEEHEPGYKSETAPRYHAREVAMQRAKLEGAKIVLGSATPSLETYEKALNGEYLLYTLTQRAKVSVLPTVDIVDMREELTSGNRTVLSHALQNKIREKLDRKQQIMLFLNRRGYSGFVSCRSCGHVMMCPHCDVSLSLHKNGKLVCHYCGYEQRKPQRCPVCESEFISGFGIGTQQAEEQVQKLFPEAKVLRMDLDTTKEKDGHEKILAAFANQEADILVGTQMIVKGHDFPNVTLVGILAADLSLYVDDFKAAERTFQLLTQAAGRAGRGIEKGEVVIQTYNPDHYCIQTAARQDYTGFYEEESGYRAIAGYPPMTSMMSVHGSCEDEGHLQLAMDYLKKMILRITDGRPVQVFGPAEEKIAKIQDIYRKVIYLKSKEERLLHAVKIKLEEYIEMNEGFKTVNIQFDRNE